ncbi:TetR/AcrR family transcriptional regulator [Oceanobacillus sp. CAU 1775]
MSEVKTDLRILRTRKLIMESFVDLSGKMEFKDITVKDITTKAMINRSTFYYHFEDIYDLLDKALTEVLFVNLSSDDYEGRTLNEESITSIFEAITSFQESLSNRCHRGYEDTIARIIRDQLEVIILKMLKRESPEADEIALNRTANFLTWGLYGTSMEWRKTNQTQTPTEFIKPIMKMWK